MPDRHATGSPSPESPLATPPTSGERRQFTQSERDILRALEVHSKTVRNGRYRKALRRLEGLGLVEVEWDNDAPPHESEIHVVRRTAEATDGC